MQSIKPKLICLTPIKNESWILELFLKSASLWADHIIIADQNSTDNSREIVKNFAKATLVDNKSDIFNETDRQKLLINEARKIPGPKILISLDADELISPNIFKSKEWESMLSLKPGTVLYFQLYNLRPDFQTYWAHNYYTPLGYVDDGSEHQGLDIHSPRIPISKESPMFFFKEVKAIHFQYVDWNRMQSKHRWYQCWERINHPERNPISIFRQYHHMYAVRESEFQQIPQSWIDFFCRKNINIFDFVIEKKYYWDKVVLNYFDTYGTECFSGEYIWDINWVKLAEDYGHKNPQKYKDPRTDEEKRLHSWLWNTRSKPRHNLVIKYDNLLLKMCSDNNKQEV